MPLISPPSTLRIRRQHARIRLGRFASQLRSWAQYVLRGAMTAAEPARPDGERRMQLDAEAGVRVIELGEAFTSRLVDRLTEGPEEFQEQVFLDMLHQLGLVYTRAILQEALRIVGMPPAPESTMDIVMAAAAAGMALGGCLGDEAICGDESGGPRDG